jgi:hypothetical protein
MIIFRISFGKIWPREWKEVLESKNDPRTDEAGAVTKSYWIKEFVWSIALGSFRDDSRIREKGIFINTYGF